MLKARTIYLELLGRMCTSGLEYESFFNLYTKMSQTGWHTDDSQDPLLNIHQTVRGKSIVLLGKTIEPLNAEEASRHSSYVHAVNRANDLQDRGLISGQILRGYSNDTNTLVWWEELCDEPVNMAHTILRGRKPRKSHISEIILRDFQA